MTDAVRPVQVDWLLLSRYGLMVALCELIPVPLLDGFVANILRRRLVRIQLHSHGLQLPRPEVRMLADATAGGCMGMIGSVVLWPLEKILRTVLLFLQLNNMVNRFSEVVHRALLVQEALEQKLVPGDVTTVRAAMNRASASVDVRVVNKSLRQVLDVSRRQLWLVVRASIGRVGTELRAEARREGIDEDDQAVLEPGPEALSVTLASAVRAPGVEDELLRAFRREVRSGDDAP